MFMTILGVIIDVGLPPVRATLPPGLANIVWTFHFEERLQY